MAIVFQTAKINLALASHDESLLKHTEMLESHAANQKMEMQAFDDKFERSITALVQKTDDLAAEIGKQMACLSDRLATLEGQHLALDNAVSLKANGREVGAMEEHLRNRITGLETQHEAMLESLATKACGASAEKHQLRLGSVAEELQNLKRDHEETAQTLHEKAGETHGIVRATHEHLGAALGRESQERQAHLESLRIELEEGLMARASVLESTVEELTNRLCSLTSEMHCGFGERAGKRQVEAQEQRLSGAVLQLTRLEQVQTDQNARVLELLDTKQDVGQAASLRGRADATLSRCATKDELRLQLSEVGRQLASDYSRVGALMEEMDKTLQTKLPRREFQELWDATIVRELTPQFQSQREELDVALVKKDQLVSLVESMKNDLRCALALKGRGPTNLPPLSLTRAKSPCSTKKRDPARAA